MKTAYILIIFLVSMAFGIPAFAQYNSFDWIKTIGDSGEDCPSKIANDNQGNVYVAGAFVGQLVFGNDTVNSYSSANAAIFLAKYDSNGNAVWGVRLPLTNTNTGSCSNIELNRVRIAQSGKIYLVGFLRYTGKSYISVIRNDGGLIGYGDQTPDAYNTDIQIDSVDNSYLVGYTYSTPSHYYVAKFDSVGNEIWGYLSSNGESKAYNISYSNGLIRIGGQFLYQITLADTFNSPTVSLNASGGLNDWDFFIAQYGADGHIQNGYRHEGPTPSPAGPFTLFSSDFKASGKWSVLFTEAPANIFHSILYTNSLSVIANNQLNHDPCSDMEIMEASTFNEHAIYSSFAFMGTCQPTWAYGVDATNQLQDSFYIPAYGGHLLTPDIYSPSVTFTSDNSDNTYLLANFHGSFQYNDSTGNTHSIQSNLGSTDIYFGKYHRSPLAVQHISINDIVKVYPNPVQSSFMIEGLKQGEVIEITDITGRILVHTLHNRHNGIDISGLATGMYFLKTRNDIIKITKS